MRLQRERKELPQKGRSAHTWRCLPRTLSGGPRVDLSRAAYWNSLTALLSAIATPQSSGIPTKAQARMIRIGDVSRVLESVMVPSPQFAARGADAPCADGAAGAGSSSLR